MEQEQSHPQRAPARASPNQANYQVLAQSADGKLGTQLPARRHGVPVSLLGKRRPPVASRHGRASLAQWQRGSRSPDAWNLQRARSGPRTPDVLPWPPAMAKLPQVACDGTRAPLLPVSPT
jgi:hypothetical protein